ncbi:platelet binding protein GspB isoform X2 [Melanotaenia boesemani]|uniref:platelet binding protein GspB isoform X2 n=1 Tax=Melanotaenia boesemani TaxID=1250792 RepID=UPI001C0497FC|nr:platelet binding protein GspB isoform X2 [Melanotaenia boesemani]
MDPQERGMASSHVPVEDDVRQSVGEPSLNPMGVQSTSSANQVKKQSRLETDGRALLGADAVQLEFQNSNLSPALPLLPVTSGVEHTFTEHSLFQQSDTELVPLRAYPDNSMASERFQLPPQDCTTYSSECSSLSQHPLAQATILSEEGAVSSCSQHSLSPGNQGNPPMIASTHDRQGILSKEGSIEKNLETQGYCRDKLVNKAAEDETFFLSKDVPAQHLLKLLQKEVGMPSSSSSAVSSASETSVKKTASYLKESKSTKVCNLTTEQSAGKREGPPGGACVLQQQVGNITLGSRSTLPDDSSEMLHRKLLSEVERIRSLEAESKSKATPTGQFFTPTFKELSEGKPSGVRVNMAGMPWTGAFSAGVEAAHREQDLWSSGNQTGIEGSYLGFLPQSQSTPGVFMAPPKSSVKVKLGQLSAIASDKENSYQSSTGAAPQLPNAHLPDIPKQCQEDALQTSAEVQSLPSLNYMQKVDAWRANHSSGNSPLFDSLALQEFPGMCPEKKAVDAASDTLNHVLTQPSRSLQQSPVSGAANKDVAQSSSTAPSGSSSSRRGEAVGSAPSDKDTRGPAAHPSASPFGRSQSPSSFDTVVMSVHKHQQTDMLPEKKKSESQNDALHRSGTTVQLSPFASLGHFSDVSLDQDLTLSSSQDSYSGVKVGASLGASSVVSLELDNYAPYWTLKPSTPPPLPKLRKFSIDEQIPLYLRNLGINQSPSTILTPFAPKGPIREPEFSPTDLRTIKGSTGTTPKSTQPSEGGSPHKEDFSRSSILSVDSSVSVPFSLDSLGPVALIPEQTRGKSSPSDTEAACSEVMATGSQSSKGNCSFILQPRQQDTRQEINKSHSDASASYKERNPELLLQSSRSQGAEDSFVSANALLDIRTLLSHAENMISDGSSAASHRLSDEDLFLSPQMKTSRLQDSSQPSTSTNEDHKTRLLSPWTRSSSDSMLSSEKPRQRSVGQESIPAAWQTDQPSPQALMTTPASVAYKTTQDTAVGSTVVLSKSARRTEPEGCSAAPPDKVPTQPLSAVSIQQLSSAPADGGGVPEEEEKPPSRDPAQSHPSSPIPEDTDQGVMSDGSSESSLAVRVAKLLHNESPATEVSSTPSTTGQEESKAREWIKLSDLIKISEQQYEPLELDIQDRKRIEEIKKDLLLRSPFKSQESTETQSSAASSVKNFDHNPVQSAEAVSVLSEAKSQQGVSTNQSDSRVQTQEALHPDLEARVCEIAAREGVTLPTRTPQAFTSISTTTNRQSPAPSPSTSPVPPHSPATDPLHLTELSTGAVRSIVANTQPSSNLNEEDKVTFTQRPIRELLSVYKPGKSFQTKNQTATSLSAQKNQKRQDTVGGHCEAPPPPSHGSDKQDKTIKHDGSPSFKHRENLSVQTSSVSGTDLRSDQSAGPTTVVSLPRTGHISHIRLAVSPQATDHNITSTVHSSHADTASGFPRKDFVPLRDDSSPPSSLDEGVGSSSPLEWYDTREPVRQRVPERSNSSTLLKNALLQERMTARATKSLTQRHRSDKPPRSFTAETPVPVLLPYKPRGSEELFYVPQIEADVSCTELSDTTMESSHTGSDDAVPPRFSSEVLGHQDSGLDHGITFRHTEGIYSKRLKTAAFKMHEPGDRANRSSPTVSQTPKTSSAAFTRVPSLSNQEVSKRDQGTSPVQSFHCKQTEPSPEKFQEVHVDMVQMSVRQTAEERDQKETSLHQLWQRFCDQWSVEESHPSSDRDATLLERLERLSRLIHSTRTANVSDVQEQDHHPEWMLGKMQGKKERKEVCREAKRSEQSAVAEGERKLRGGRQTEPPIQVRLQTMETVEDGSRDSLSSSQSHHLSPADESENLSTTSSSMSTIDTARLIRAFGAHKVQHLKSSSSLRKLYSTIDKQKEGKERWRGRHKDPRHLITPSETPGTVESVAPDSASTTSTNTPTSHRGPSRSLTKKVNKSIQAGDLEIVRNGTRRHTRDVGITFPSPGEARASGQISSSSSSTVRERGQKSPSKSQGVQKRRKNKKSPSKPYPEGVSWFISADDLRSEARKENQPEDSYAWRPSTVWFEQYSRVSPWREPLRLRQVHEDKSKESSFKHQAEPDPDPRVKTLSSGMALVSLQEALQMHRPEFVSRSRQRLRRLALQAEERKLQAAFSRERGVLFNQPGGPTRLPKPAGTALLRKAVPKKEMIQRSKQIYENLPEVRRRREEERRKADYQSYRLNAELYSKTITNRVLGRRTAWQ